MPNALLLNKSCIFKVTSVTLANAAITYPRSAGLLGHFTWFERGYGVQMISSLRLSSIQGLYTGYSRFAFFCRSMDICLKQSVVTRWDTLWKWRGSAVTIQIHHECSPSSNCTNTLRFCRQFPPILQSLRGSKHPQILCQLDCLSESQPTHSVPSLALQPIHLLASEYRLMCKGFHSHMRHDNQTLDVRQSHIALFSSPEPFRFHIKMVSTSARISRDGKSFRGVGIHLSRSANSPANLACQIWKAWATYTSHGQDDIHKKRCAVFRTQVTRLHIPQEDCLVNQLAAWVIPGKV